MLTKERIRSMRGKTVIRGFTKIFTLVLVAPSIQLFPEFSDSLLQWQFCPDTSTDTFVLYVHLMGFTPFMFMYSDPKRQEVIKMIGFYPVAGNACAVYKNLDRRLPL
jgi:hypothetical protein